MRAGPSVRAAAGGRFIVRPRANLRDLASEVAHLISLGDEGRKVHKHGGSDCEKGRGRGFVNHDCGAEVQAAPGLGLADEGLSHFRLALMLTDISMLGILHSLDQPQPHHHLATQDAL